MRRNGGFALWMAVAPLVLGACAREEAPARLVALHANPPAFAFAVGDEFEVAAIGEDAAGRRFEVAPAWTSSDPAIVEVSAEGRAIGQSPGTATLVARTEGLSAAIEARVLRRVEGLRILPEEIRLRPGDALDLELVATDAAGVKVEADAKWSSSDPSVARVEASGRLEAMAVGSAEIAAEAQGARATALLTVEPLPPHAIQISAPKSELEVGETIPLSAVVRDRAGGVIEGAPLEWESLSPQALSVDPEGRATLLRPAPAEVRASSGEAEGIIRLEGRIRYRQLVRLTDSVGDLITHCGLDPRGIAYCHGDNFFGQLGDETLHSTDIPIRVKGAPPFVRLSVPRAQEEGTVAHFTIDGITEDGRVFRWGQGAPEGNWLSLGHSVVARIDRPWKDGRRMGPLIPGLEDLRDSPEGREICDLTEGGAAICGSVQVVRDGWNLPKSPEPSPEYAAIVKVSAAQPVCWLYETGEVSCRATIDEEGECLDEQNLQKCLRGRGIPISLPEPALDIAAAGHSTCALLESGEVYCWQHVHKLVPVSLVHSIWHFVGISAAQPVEVPFPISRLFPGWDRICGLAGGRTYCWDLGVLEEGELGDFRWLGTPYVLDTGGIAVREIDLFSELLLDEEGRYWILGPKLEPFPRQP